MRGDDRKQQALFSYVSPEARIPRDHPLRPIRKMVDSALKDLSPLLEEMYSHTGRPSIAPEQLLRALLLQILYSIRSERMLVEQTGLQSVVSLVCGPVHGRCDLGSFYLLQNRERLIDHEMASLFFESIRAQAEQSGILSDEHFTVDGTLIEAWASLKSFHPESGNDRHPPCGGSRNPEIDFKGQIRKNDTHRSTYGSGIPVVQKSQRQRGQALLYGPCPDGEQKRSCGRLPPHASQRHRRTESRFEMIESLPGTGRITVGADKGYDAASFVHDLRQCKVTPHVAQKSKSSAIDQRTTRHEGYRTSQILRKRVEEIFGWAKTIGMLRKTRHRGVQRVQWAFTLTTAAFNLVRMRTWSPKQDERLLKWALSGCCPQKTPPIKGG